MLVKNLDVSYHDECRANAEYVKGALQVHFIKRTIRGAKCVLDFFETSESREKSFPSNKPHRYKSSV